MNKNSRYIADSSKHWLAKTMIVAVVSVVSISSTAQPVARRQAQQQQKQNGKGQPEEQRQRIADDLFGAAAREAQHAAKIFHFAASSPTRATKASSKLSVPAAAISSSAVPSRVRRPWARMPMRSLRAWASSR